MKFVITFLTYNPPYLGDDVAAGNLHGDVCVEAEAAMPYDG